MTKKKSSKKAIDYDPLAWMDHEEAEAPGEEATEEPQAIAPSIGDEVQLETADSAEVEVEDGEEAVEAAEAATEEDLGYGFFDDDDTVQADTTIASFDRESNLIDLGADLTIRSAASCKSVIDACLQQGSGLRLSAGRLQKIDTAGLQLLLSLDNSMRNTATVLEWVDGLDIVNSAAKRIGLAAFATQSTAAAGETDLNPGNDSDSDAGFGFF